MHFKKKLGEGLNWRLSFEEYKEAATTKHVHRLHPYKGKFIPQLVEYFLDVKTDEFKTSAIFKPEDIVLDPFCGSGTTLIQANELGIHAIGIDVSCFNAMISNLKLCRLPTEKIAKVAYEVEKVIERNPSAIKARQFEMALLQKLKMFNGQYFPSPEYKWKVRRKEIDEKKYGQEKAQAFLPVYEKLKQEFDLHKIAPFGSSFLDTWYLQPVRCEIELAANCINKINDEELRNMLRLILSRTIRSARATTHADLATLIKPVIEPYYCGKHGKVCKPLFSMLAWWKRYVTDTIKRLHQFSEIRSDTRQFCLSGDAREMNLLDALNQSNKELFTLAKNKKIKGIFSSPPYVGLINYHDQHAYSYELFGYPNNEKNEIGILQKGQGKQARDEYIQGVSAALQNCVRFMVKDYDIFLVANDKFGLYPHIAERSGMKIVQECKRPVLNRAEGNKGAYSESIFHIRPKRWA